MVISKSFNFLHKVDPTGNTMLQEQATLHKKNLSISAPNTPSLISREKGIVDTLNSVDNQRVISGFSQDQVKSFKTSNVSSRNDSTVDKIRFNIPEDPAALVSQYVLLSTYISFGLLIVVAFFRDLISKILYPAANKDIKFINGYAPFTTGYDSFFTRRVYRRIRDCWNRPIKGTAGKYLNVLIRRSDDENASFQMTGEVRKCLNFSSYNYLGFSQSNGPCLPAVKQTIQTCGMSSGSTAAEIGYHRIHQDLESLVARFLGTEDAILCNMGYATNLMHLPGLLSGKGTLILSDSLNHTSLVYGCKLATGVIIKVFRHNDLNHLRKMLRESISSGQPRTHRPWKKIFVLVEGLYSMEGTIPDLRGLLALKSRYKFYLWVDEAHSIGALGPSGRGICDHYGLSDTDRAQIDILMGTFTKSFGAAGGYIAGAASTIRWLRAMGHCSLYAETMSPGVAQMVLESMRAIINENPVIKDGPSRLQKIKENSIYFRSELKRRGFVVLGDDPSPVIPLILFQPTKMTAFSRELLARGIAVVIVAYPACPMHLARARFCMSSNQSEEDLEYVLQAVDEIGDLLNIKFGKPPLWRQIMAPILSTFVK